MGNALETSAVCPLCNEQTSEIVTLKCNHFFCRRCIGDLWSVCPDGPYCCPEWRCKAEYRKLPFSNVVTRPYTANRWTSSASSPSEVKTDLTRPSLPSRLLGKRKASTSAPEQPDTKRTALESRPQSSSASDPPATSSTATMSQSTAAEPSKEAGRGEGVQPELDGSLSSSDTSGSDVTMTNHEPQNRPTQPEPDSDSSDELDVCEVPAVETPKKITPQKESPESPRTISPVSPISTLERVKNHGTHVSRSPSKFTKVPEATRGSSSSDGASPKPPSKHAISVPCHYCPTSGQQSAVKTCLVCGASMCKEHLRSHLESPVFQNHILVAPLDDISSWKCLEHQEMNRIFCRQCAICVCTVCTVIGSHRDHACISIRDAERELRGNLKDEIRQLQKTETHLKTRVAELMQKKADFGALLSDARAGVKQQYGTIREAVEQEEQSALQCVTTEETKVLGGLEKQLSHLQSSLESIQEGLHSLEGLADAKGDKSMQDQAFIMEYNKMTEMVGGVGSSVKQLEPPEEVDQARLGCLQRWTEKRLDTVVLTAPDRDFYRLMYGTVPLLDADTAHPKLLLSEDGRRVTYTEVRQIYTDSEAQFISFPQVLGSRALQEGRHYWEVDVTAQEGRWKVGLCEGQIERKGQKDCSRLGFNSFSWCIGCEKKKLEALHDKVAVPVVTEGGLQKVGVFLDFDEGTLSFYKVTPEGGMVLLHSYTHQFSDPLYPALSVSKTHLTVCDLFQQQ